MLYCINMFGIKEVYGFQDQLLIPLVFFMQDSNYISLLMYMYETAPTSYVYMDATTYVYYSFVTLFFCGTIFSIIW